NEDEEIKKVVDIAVKLEDFPRQTSTHACGVIIVADVLDKHVPLARNGDDITTQYEGAEMEHLGRIGDFSLGIFLVILSNFEYGTRITRPTSLITFLAAIVPNVIIRAIRFSPYLPFT
ncbi:MAG: hypothetical protein J6Q15_03415, partial [Clostridia bacterium]|nr:hypothetical protein [Clostridia bacterium]